MLNLSQIKSIMQTGDLKRFVGEKENLYFEGKGSNPYNLTDPNGRYELAKDVSSFANSEGGYIVIGLERQDSPTAPAEEIKALDLITKEEWVASNYAGAAVQYIYPPLKLESGWVEDISKKGLGVGYIHIPNQPENRKFFLIKRVIENNAIVKGIVFGLAKRNKSDSTPLTVDQVYQMIQGGKSEVSQRLTSIESKIDKLLPPKSTTKPNSPAKKLNERIKGIENE